MDQDQSNLMFDFSRFYILMILYEGPIHGYGIMQKFKERTGKEVSTSLVYPFLRVLEEHGYVTQEVQFVGQKEKKVFKLTPEGKKFCETLFKRFSIIVETAIEPNLETCASCGIKVYQGGYKEVIDGKELTFCCVHCAKSYKQHHSSH